MFKKLILAIVIVGVLAIGWYLISPVWRVEERNEPSPLEGAMFKDSFETMTDEEMKEFTEAVEEASVKVMTMDESMPATPEIVAQGNFMPRAHEVAGKALLISSGGGKILRFEDFETVNGPNLHIYLSTDLGDDDYIDLGEIRATKGNVNYEIDPAIDIQKYNKVLVWCVPFRVLFSYAELK